ncbi:MAG: cytochrome c3 family protein [Caulobacteraceae bacterium]
MTQLFRPGADVIAHLALIAIVTAPFVLIGLLYVYTASPYRTGEHRSVEQTVPFSHEHHVADLGIDCRFCHLDVETGRFAGMPSTHTCMTCHSQIWTNAAMLAPVRLSLVNDQPLKWTQVNNLPDYVYFDHSVHIAKGIGCATCHGPVAQMPLTRQHASLAMSWCLGCHRNPAPNLRPRSEIYNTSWQPPPDHQRLAERLMRAYHIQTLTLTDCSTCHR